MFAGSGGGKVPLSVRQLVMFAGGGGGEVPLPVPLVMFVGGGGGEVPLPVRLVMFAGGGGGEVPLPVRLLPVERRHGAGLAFLAAAYHRHREEEQLRRLRPHPPRLPLHAPHRPQGQYSTT